MGAMSSSHPDLRFTYQDYLVASEAKRCELIDGDLIVVPSPTPYHQLVSGRLEDALNEFLRGSEAGIVLYAPCDVYLSEHDVVQPDILVISADRLGIVKEKYIQGAPDLVVEILSASSESRDRGIKAKLYSRFGVREYWIVDPDGKTIEVQTRQDARLRTEATYVVGDHLKSTLLEGFTLDLTGIFAPLGV